MLLNSVGKLGQQNGLFCYSSPDLIISKHQLHSSENKSSDIRSTASENQLFSFVYSHYKTIRLLLLFWYFVKYERSFPVFSLVKAFFEKKYFQVEIDLAEMVIDPEKNIEAGETIDVIIPTMGRKEYLL